ncbi:UL31-like protein [Bufonid herpesvirus 1]|uniref:UL31-like protein n=1 Tax=Bufonid herpesvirus 1 TaxID=2282206 RepID=UPI000EB75B90|nr:UL31-like protein [Bufonid herpesvirus 1]AXF48579.1 UL31-like protein [Bufonid herpesvirus 1]
MIKLLAFGRVFIIADMLAELRGFLVLHTPHLDVLTGCIVEPVRLKHISSSFSSVSINLTMSARQAEDPTFNLITAEVSTDDMIRRNRELAAEKFPMLEMQSAQQSSNAGTRGSRSSKVQQPLEALYSKFFDNLDCPHALAASFKSAVEVNCCPVCEDLAKCDNNKLSDGLESVDSLEPALAITVLHAGGLFLRRTAEELFAHTSHVKLKSAESLDEKLNTMVDIELHKYSILQRFQFVNLENRLTGETLMVPNTFAGDAAQQSINNITKLVKALRGGSRK